MISNSKERMKSISTRTIIVFSNMVSKSKEDLILTLGPSINVFPNCISFKAHTTNNVKYFYNKGTFQITGCKEMELASTIIKEFFEKTTFLPKDEFFFYVLPVLTTQQLKKGFSINQKKLASLMCEAENVFPITSSDKYAGVVFKSIIRKSLRELPLRKWQLVDTEWTSVVETNPKFLNAYFTKKERSLAKKVTFIVFGTGSITITSPHESMVENEVTHFLSTLEEFKTQIII